MNLQLEKNLKELENLLRADASFLREELRGVRGNRPSVEIIENIKVECYGQRMTVKQLGSLSLRPPREVEIQVWDKTAVQAITKGIEEAKIGMSVSNDSNIVRASLPILTDERRKELSKLAGKITETAKIKLRSQRDEAIKKFKTAKEKGEITEDDFFQAKEKIQKSVDEANQTIETMFREKIKEIEE